MQPRQGAVLSLLGATAGERQGQLSHSRDPKISSPIITDGERQRARGQERHLSFAHATTQQDQLSHIRTLGAAPPPLWKTRPALLCFLGKYCGLGEARLTLLISLLQGQLCTAL